MPGTSEAAEFKFVQLSEFAKPFYIFRMDGICYGNIKYANGRWLGCLRDDYRYGSDIFIIMAAKVDQLNAELVEQRKVFFGL